MIYVTVGASTCPANRIRVHDMVQGWPAGRTLRAALRRAALARAEFLSAHVLEQECPVTERSHHVLQEPQRPDDVGKSTDPLQNKILPTLSDGLFLFIQVG